MHVHLIHVEGRHGLPYRLLTRWLEFIKDVIFIISGEGRLYNLVVAMIDRNYSK